ncbi:MAG: hypothetical protein AAGE65_01440 [Planctomycetota bacterium]
MKKAVLKTSALTGLVFWMMGLCCLITSVLAVMLAVGAYDLERTVRFWVYVVSAGGFGLIGLPLWIAGSRMTRENPSSK